MRGAQAGASAAVRGQAARSGLRLKPRRRSLVAPVASTAATARTVAPSPGRGARRAPAAVTHSAEPGTAPKGRDRSSDGTALKEPIKIHKIL